ncbi:acyltransferase family protein [Leifsonia sp. Root112D2]|uniref:acyltransferase family protein n=1 Tax=Leifsonia sp. Root112D2 TaxID=1736426 RepID=UPI0006F5879D|nr:acyltransferase family protein [Leifsonia sp. Root112D2]KQV07003.1 hypothetical protein ASC63_06570 [Leifsonia sp. Root112D2]
MRADVQGLRALAVIAVILDHLLVWPSGGFVGVDIFFVISGFLITGLLLREQERTGKISFVGFYRRRIKRILPASMLVLAVTVAAAFAVFNIGRALQTETDAIWATFFSANWHFALIGTDYFQADGPTSALQHYWSLGVEEQFYFVWPWLMLLIFVVTRRVRGGKFSGRKAVAATMVVIIVVSLAWSVWETFHNPSFAYFSTLSRAWELGVGALLAVATKRLERLPSRIRPLLAWCGLAVIVASLFIINDSLPFPAPWAMLPVLGTAAVIAAGTGAPAMRVWPLTSKPAGYVGEISYSLYLWHFPVIIIAASLLPTTSVITSVATILLVFGLAAASFHWFENPIRNSTWLDRLSRHERRQRRWRGRQRLHATLNWPVVGYATLAAITIWTVGIFIYPIASAPAAISRGSVNAASGLNGEETAVKLTGRAADIQAALSATAFPKLSPPVEQLGTENWVKQVNKSGCAEITAKNAEKCIVGPSTAKVNVAVLGDSIGIAWTPGLQAAADKLGWRLHPFTMGQCPATTVDVTWTGGKKYDACNAHRDWAIAQIRALHPDVTILASASNTITRLSSEASGTDAVAEVTKGTEQTIRALSDSTGTVIVLAAPPDGKSLLVCNTRFATPSSCVAPIRTDWLTMNQAEQAAASEAHARYFDTSSWFCSSDGSCPAFVGTVPVRTDENHLTVAYSSGLGPELADMLSKSAP